MSVFKNEIIGITASAIFIILLCIVTYGQILNFDFINLDDDAYITLNPIMREGLGWQSIKWAFTTFSEPYYMPLTRISYLVDSSIYGIHARGFHLTNLVIHIINSLIVLVILARFTKTISFSAFVAVLFAIHPQHIEAFVWIAERKEVLSALFGLSSLAMYITHVTILCAGRKTDHRYYLLAIILLIFSLLAKPVWLTFPFILLLIDWWPLQRFSRESIIRILIEKSPFLVICLLFSFITLYSAASTVDHITNDAQTLPVYQRILNIPVIYTEYLIKTFYPANLSGYYPYPREFLSFWELSGAAFLILGVSFLVFNAKKKSPYLLAGWLWFLGTLFPMTGIVSAGESVFIANRWTYLPHLGLFMAITWHALILYNNHVKSRIYLVSTGLSVLVIFSILSFNQSNHWQNSETYWQQVLSTTRNNHNAHYMLGTYYLNIKETGRAIHHLEIAYNQNPDEAFYALMLGNAYAKTGDMDTAWKYFNLLVKTAPPNINLLTQMGLKAMHNHRYETALAFFQAAIDSNVERPHHYKFQRLAFLYAGLALNKLNSNAKARKMFEDFIGNNQEEKFIMCNYAEIELAKINPGLDVTKSLEIIKEICAQ